MGRTVAVVLFTDLLGSTGRRGRLGEEAAGEPRQRHDRLLADRRVGVWTGGEVSAWTNGTGGPTTAKTPNSSRTGTGEHRCRSDLTWRPSWPPW